MYKNAYYIHQYSYNQPPLYIDNDMQWLVDHGFNAISIAVNEIDLLKNPLGIDRLFNSAKKHGLKVHLVPSRWGGIVAGTPGIQSYFCMKNPKDTVLAKDGTPILSGLWGTMASIHSPNTYNFFCEAFDSIYGNWHFDGIIWDEPKCFNIIDYNPLAQKKRPIDSGIEWDREQFASFFDRIGAYIRAKYQNVELAMFLYGDIEDEIFDCCCKIINLDDLGIDGSPFLPNRNTDKRKKTLIKNAAYFRDKVLDSGKNSLILIENFNMTKDEDKMMDLSLPTIIGYNIDHVLAYYYGRNNEDPDGNMKIIVRHLCGFHILN